MSSEKDDCSAGACPVDKNKVNLVKSTDLPLTGNPYPPKDVIQDKNPGAVEQYITTARTVIQPYLSPIGTAYSKVSDIVVIGKAHSQSAFQNIFDNQNALTSGLVIAGSTLFGLMLARKKGIFKKMLITSTFLAGSTALCNREAAQKYIEIGWVMAKNKIE